MKRLLLSAILILAANAIAHGLKCYECTGTEDSCSKETLEKDKDKYLKDCSVDEDRCVRLWGVKDGTTRARVVKDCADQERCKKGKARCDEGKEGKCVVDCCDTDACNAVTPVLSSVTEISVSFSLFLMAVCSGLIFLQ